MGDLIALLFVAAIFATLGVVVFVKWMPRQEPKEEIRGTWYRAQETVASRNGSTVRVLLIREHEGRETGRLVVAEVDSSDPKWTAKFQEAMAEAENRLANLESGERR